MTGTAELDRWAFLYTATARGNSTGIRYMATVEDAMTWCSSPLSRGVIRGTAWAFFWTRVKNFIRHHESQAAAGGLMPRPRVDLTGCVDDGTFDERIATTGCRLVRLDQIADVLTPLSIEVVGVPKVSRRAA